MNMKKFHLLLCMLFCAFSLMAQAPNKFTYQAVVRNANNQLVSNTLVGVRISVLQNSATGSVVYSETQMLSTNTNGLVTLNIGEGNAVYGSLNNVSWGNGIYFLKSEIDPNGGSSYSITSTQQLLSVPYALYANEAGNSFSGDYNDLTNLPQIPQVPADVSAFNNDAGYITMDSVPAIPTQVSAFNNDAGYITSADLQGLLAGYSSRIDSLENLLLEGAVLTTYECGTSTVKDYDGNVYNTVPIGNQCWLKENLRTTHFSNGTSITLGTSYGVSTPARYYPNHDSANVGSYGYLYNWAAVMNDAASSSATPSGVHGICPLGWHVPSDAEWTQMENFVSSQDQYLCNNSASNIAKALTSATGWNSSSAACAVGNDLNTNNATGFSAMPAGDCHYNWGYENFGNGTLFWTSTENSSNGNAWRRYLSYNAAVVNRDNKDKGNGFSVRCLRDNGVGGLAVAHNGNETANQIEDLQQQILQMQARMDSLEARTDSLSAVTDSLGSLMDECGCSAFECGVTPLLDYDSNTYNTVQLGSKCWMAENLRTTHYSNGLSIELGPYSDGSVPYRYYPNNNSANVENYGYLYNWAAVMHGAASSDANPSKVQGVCPKGWHVPSSAEWTELTTYVSGQSQYLCDNNTANIAKALASTTGWNSNSTTCAVGNNPGANNATGFGAMPAGDRHYNWGNENFGIYAIFWSATEITNNNAGRLLIGYNSASTDFSYKDKGNAFSVRCVHN